MHARLALAHGRGSSRGWCRRPSESRSRPLSKRLAIVVPGQQQQAGDHHQDGEDLCAETLEERVRGPVQALADRTTVLGEEVGLEEPVADGVIGSEAQGLRREGEQQGTDDERGAPRSAHAEPRSRAARSGRRRARRRRAEPHRRPVPPRIPGMSAASHRPCRRPSRGRGRMRHRRRTAIRARPKQVEMSLLEAIDDIAQVAARRRLSGRPARRRTGRLSSGRGTGLRARTGRAGAGLLRLGHRQAASTPVHAPLRGGKGALISRATSRSRLYPPC